MPGRLEDILERKLNPAWGPRTRFNEKKCPACGDCCRANVFVSFEEIEEIAKKTGIPALFIMRDCEVDGTPLKRLAYKRLDDDKSACYFYTGHSCKLHEKYGKDIKPYICWTYPYLCLDENEVPDRWTEKDRKRCRHKVTAKSGFQTETYYVYLACDEMCKGIGSGRGKSKRELPQIIKKMLDGKAEWYKTQARLMKGEPLITDTDKENFAKRIVNMTQEPGKCTYAHIESGKDHLSCLIEPPRADIDYEKILKTIKATQKEIEATREWEYWMFCLQEDYENIGIMFCSLKELGAEELGEFAGAISEGKAVLKALGFGFYDTKTNECCTLH